MIVGSTKEDLLLEKRVSITPDVAKNIINLGLKICIEKNYALHLGIQDKEYIKKQKWKPESLHGKFLPPIEIFTQGP